MRPRIAVGCALVLAAAAPGFAQDSFEPNPSLARLSADAAYARTSARSLRTAGIDAAVAIRLDDAGRVLVLGFSFPFSRVARLDVDGRLDPTFGTSGVAEMPVMGKPGGLEVDAAGRIVVTGVFYDAGTYPWGDPAYVGPEYGAARLLADGSLDRGFSGDGLLELDAASGLHGLGAVRASGGDGAMLAVAEKPNPTLSYRTLVGLVRIAADGTIDATYGVGGFAEVPHGLSSYPQVNVEDFEVDSAGGAWIAAENFDAGLGIVVATPTVVRLDAAGGLDPAFWTKDLFGSYQPVARFRASQIAIDGAGRIVGVDGVAAQLWRRLPDGAHDPTFSGDGSAWNQFAFFVGLTLDQRSALYAAESQDPDRTGDSLDGELLAVATSADRWVLAKRVDFRNPKGGVVARGLEVRAIDPADPGAIVAATYRVPDWNFNRVADLAIAPDGTAAYALGETFVLRVDLAKRKALPLPDLRVQWLGWPHARDFAGGRYRVSARVRIRNVSARAASVLGDVAIGDGSFDGPLHPLVPLQRSATSSRPFTLRGRSSVVRRFTWEGTYGPADLAGARLSVRVRSELPDANPADNAATSRTLSPLYAPR